VAQTQYFIEITSPYLGKYRKVTGRTKREVELKAAEQLQRWDEQEARARARDAAADAKEQARLQTEASQAAIEEHRAILQATLGVDDRLDWEAMLDRTPFDESAPSLEEISAELAVPKRRGLIERVSTKTRETREAAEREADRLLAERLRAREERLADHQEAQKEHNASVEAFRESYEAGDPEAVERYISLVLASSVFPTTFSGDYAVGYFATDHTLVVDVPLPTPDDLPQVDEYRYVASRQAIDEKRLKEKELAELYDQAVVQTVLRTLHEVFEGDYAKHFEICVVNGTIESVDRATGKDYAATIVSCQAEREAFLAIDLARVDPIACFRGLRGLSGAKMIGLQPVRPIRVLNKEDPRFVEAREVLDGLEAGQNLMTMDWQDFEMLVRDLFEEMFAGKGGEVKVTRTSRDQGVDAVVFDPDPLTGGKTVIQAKRYRGAVPVAAVRELYGTMINEGAGKGILVTTSHFGATALEFSKDKPITLLDGANLLHLLQNHGHNLRIDVSEGAPDPLLEPGLVPDLMERAGEQVAEPAHEAAEQPR
jgi:restriction system protein